MIGGFTIQSIDEVDISEKKVFVRVDFNVSFTADNKISDDTRILHALPTITHLLKHGNKLILASHLGRPKGRDKQFSLKAIADHLQTLIPTYEIVLLDDFTLESGKKILGTQTQNQIVLLENIRFYEGEKKNDNEFAKSLASLADVYVNDAFGAIHRAHASTEGIAHYLPSYAGLLVKREVEMMSAVTQNPKHPFVAIIGGAKISTKIGLLHSLMQKADFILVGGGLANTFLKARGINVGKSLVEDEALDVAKSILDAFYKSNCKLLLLDDAVVADMNDSNTQPATYDVDQIPDNKYILDIGIKTMNNWRKVLINAKTIVWNGPVGLFEKEAYKAGTDFIYNEIVKNSVATSIVGGGDTLAAIAGKADNSKITHISTGGGAMLEFIEKGTLPGIEALKHHS